MEDRIVEKLRKVLALTTSPVEGEAQAAALILQDLLVKHNLDIADLETRGKAKSAVREEGHDLGKAAFTWKLNLAEGIAKHYYCYPLVDRKGKTVRFVGRPDNVDSLKVLYQWLIDQIRRVSTEERKKWMEETGDHVDPLRWQVNFGIGSADRLLIRLEERAREVKEDSRCRALVVHHETEISDYLEKRFGYRADGQETAAQRKRREEWERREKEMQDLKETDPEEYYRLRPWERPLTEEEKAERDKENERWNKEYARKARARERYRERNGYRVRTVTAEESRKNRQAGEAKTAGRKAGDRINLEPFVEGNDPENREYLS